jgi:hypothetical protein
MQREILCFLVLRRLEERVLPCTARANVVHGAKVRKHVFWNFTSARLDTKRQCFESMVRLHTFVYLDT